jgi:hypothetical protein
MGILDRFFAKKVKPDETRVSLSEVEELISKKIRSDFESLRDAMKAEHDAMIATADIMKSQVNVLEQAKYPERTYPIIISKSNVSRKNFVTKMNLLVSQIKKPVGQDMDLVLDFYSGLGKAVASINSETIKDYAFLKILFEKEGKDVVETFKQILEESRRADETLMPLRRSIEIALTARSLLAEISRMRENIGGDDIRKMDVDILGKEESLREIEAKLKDLTGGSDWKSAIEIQENSDRMRSTLNEKRREFENHVDSIEIPLKKYKRLSEDRLLDDYISKSFDSAICEDPRGEKMLSWLSKIKVMIIEGEMDIKDRDKTLTSIDRIKESNLIGKSFQDYICAAEALKRNEEKASSLEAVKSKTALDVEMNRLKAQIEQAISDRRKAEEISGIVGQRRSENIKKLEGMLCDIFGKKTSVE